MPIHALEIAKALLHSSVAHLRISFGVSILYEPAWPLQELQVQLGTQLQAVRLWEPLAVEPEL